MGNKKQKLYIVPHTHWDREWYFSKNTGDVLLNAMLNDLTANKNSAIMMLDGQFSLIDDYLKGNHTKREKIISLLKSGDISSGPFYTQPDVFNSSGETTLRNIEMGQQIAEELGAKQLKTAYLPDTFGFNNNLPQIFNLKGLSNFIFWRGPEKSDLDKSFYFTWQGIDGSEVNSYNYRNGYFQLGGAYPYNSIEKKSKSNDQLVSAIEKFADKVNIEDGKAKLLPMGGDQAPFMHEALDLLKYVNQKSSKYEIIPVSNFDEFFKINGKPNHKVSGVLRTPYTGKIHRTISSSRYDIKKSFRDAENKLYYLLEPLEIYFSQFDKSYMFEKFKEENIVKPLLVGQAHDSLGGCNTDSTNDDALARTMQVQNYTMSQVDLIMKKMINHNNVENGNLVIFNPAPFPTKLFERKIIYSSTNELNGVKNNEISIHTLTSKNISFNPDKPIYEQDVIILKKNLKPISISNVSLIDNDYQYKEILENKFISISNNKIMLSIKDKVIGLHFNAITDDGDGYDFSPGKILTLHQKHLITNSFDLDDDHSVILLSSELKIGSLISNIEWTILVDKELNKIKTDFDILNRFSNTRISLKIDSTYKELKKSQHLAISNFVEDDFSKDWENNLKEYPAHVDQNDGLISLDNLNIMTSGTNELFKSKDGIELILYRTNSYVTAEKMKWRPSTSGLSFKWDAPEANMLKTLKFNLEFNISDDKMKVLNEWKYIPYSYKVQHRNFIANKMSKFVINDILDLQNKKFELTLSNENIFVSSLRINNNNLHMRLANMLDKKQELTIKTHNKEVRSNFNAYQIIELKIEGVF